jgi:hypothetical protein
LIKQPENRREDQATGTAVNSPHNWTLILGPNLNLGLNAMLYDHFPIAHMLMIPIAIGTRRPGGLQCAFTSVIKRLFLFVPLLFAPIRIDFHNVFLI